MNRVDHRLLGSAWGLAYGTALHVLHGAPLGVVLGCGAAAAATAGGRLSPDVDQVWRDRTVRYRFLGVAYERRVRPSLPLRALRWAWRRFAEQAIRLPWWRDGGYRLLVERQDPSRHRGITHWPGAAMLAGLLLAAAEAVWFTGMWAAGWPVLPWWAGWAALAGWCSHLAGDYVHGRTVWGQDGPGIPIAPFWGHHGVGLRSAGWAAHLVAWCVAVPAALAMVKVSAGI